MAKRSGTRTVLKKQPKKPVRLVTKAHRLERDEAAAGHAGTGRRPHRDRWPAPGRHVASSRSIKTMRATGWRTSSVDMLSMCGTIRRGSFGRGSSRPRAGRRTSAWRWRAQPVPSQPNDEEPLT